MKKHFLILAYACICTTVLIAQPTQPGTPPACNSGSCTPATSETCTGNSNVVTNFTNAVLRSGSPTALPAVYSFYNIATISGQQINATITIESQSNCDMTGANFSIDDDAATDQVGNSIASFFAPRITPLNTLTTSDQRGYVQFVIRFFVENGTAGQQYPGDFTTVPTGGLSGLNYIHYDIDGSTVGTGGWFRETGVIQNVPASVINANVPTELASYTYTDGGGWKGFAGSVCERTGVSRCAEVAAAARYNLPQTLVRFRMGYDYNFTTASFASRPTRQYGSRFGCFDFPQLGTLPVRLLSFSGTYKNNNALLNWAADNQVNFTGYEVERSTDGVNFGSIGYKEKQNESLQRQDYQLTDDLSSSFEKVFYYRLRMIDIDGKYTYSNTIMLRKDGSKNTSIIINPNPVVTGGAATLRFDAATRTTVEVRVVDMTGKVVLRQQNNVYDGLNSIGINNMDRLQPGMYMVQLHNNGEVLTTKLSVAR
jgi:hypothetical protein